MSSSLFYSLLMIAMHPEIQAKLQTEIDEEFGDENNPTHIKGIHRLTYLSQFLKESQRRFSLVPLSPRELHQDIKIGTDIFPAGTGIMINHVGVHLDPKYYPEPLKFNPDNFMPDAVEKRPKYAFVPFGGGMEMCLGKYFAIVEMKLTIVALLRTFSFRTSTKIEDIKSTMVGFTMRCSKGYPISISLRNSNNKMN